MKSSANTTRQRKNAGKTRGKPFKRGNPGRPKGSLNKVTLAIEVLLEGEAEKLTRKAIELALGGDLIAIKLCLDRICPPRKRRTINMDLSETETISDISKAHTLVIKGVGDGTLDPDEGQILSNILEARRKDVETEKIEQRINVLEEIAMQR
jgi:hypothetical protein